MRKADFERDLRNIIGRTRGHEIYDCCREPSPISNEIKISLFGVV